MQVTILPSTVSGVRPTRHHLLLVPNGDKRAAWAALVMFVDLNGGAWEPDPPNVDDAEAAMLTVAAHEVDEVWLADWLRERVHFE